MAGLAVALGVLLVYATVAGVLGRWSVSAPIVLVSAGIVLGNAGTGVLHLQLDPGAVRTTAEITLALLLFTDASTIRLREAEGDAQLPGRLLGIGLPLTMALGTLAARSLLPVSWAQAALIATVLAPTDAALGLDVVTNQAVPVRIRRALNIESGLNDGIATPFVVFFLAVVAAEEAHQHWILGGIKEIAVAVAFGAGLGLLAGWAAARAHAAGWTTPLSDSLAVLSIALLAYVGSVAVHGNGFVAAFVAGIFFGAAGGRALREAATFTEDLGLLLSFAVWIVFGALFAGPVLRGAFHPRALLYAVLSLTVIRMVPVALALLGMRLRRDTVGFVGWFGPRGLASVVFTLLIYEDLAGSNGSNGLVEVATWTILLSVVAHGLSARPLARAYAARLSHAPADIPELARTIEPRTRRRSLHDHRSA
jgi:NhaP-type Na+/H+ or K+/H+ antiporter